jgi:hypothetical protein
VRNTTIFWPFLGDLCVLTFCNTPQFRQQVAKEVPGADQKCINAYGTSGIVAILSAFVDEHIMWLCLPPPPIEYNMYSIWGGAVQARRPCVI